MVNINALAKSTSPTGSWVLGAAAAALRARLSPVRSVCGTPAGMSYLLARGFKV